MRNGSVSTITFKLEPQTGLPPARRLNPPTAERYIGPGVAAKTENKSAGTLNPKL